jgi:hypothetical protein
MKKLLGIVVLGLLLSGNGYAEEIYLACGKKNKDKINIVFNNETAFERYKIKKTYKKFNFESIKISKYYVELKRPLRHWKINRYTGLGTVVVGGVHTFEYNCEKLEKKF